MTEDELLAAMAEAVIGYVNDDVLADMARILAVVREHDAARVPADVEMTIGLQRARIDALEAELDSLRRSAQAWGVGFSQVARLSAEMKAKVDAHDRRKTQERIDIIERLFADGFPKDPENRAYYEARLEELRAELAKLEGRADG